MKHGDFVRVFYPYGGEVWDGPFHGFICMTPDDHADAVWQMWCIERRAYHIIRPWHDKVEVISSS